LAEISKISAVAIANVAKVDAVTKANIADINGLTLPSAAFTGLLDETYGSGAAAAYSVRRLATATTVLLRVRRDTGGGTGDDDEADVAYDSNNELSLDSAISNASSGVTATTLGQFINVGTVGGTTYTNPDSLSGTASCFVDQWKDQSGNGNDAEQNTHGSQPQIHDGTVNTDLITENGKPAVKFDRSNDSSLNYSNFISNATNAISVAKNTASAWGDLTGELGGSLRCKGTGDWTASTNGDDFQHLGSLFIDGTLLSSGTIDAAFQRLIYANAQTGGFTDELKLVGKGYPNRNWNGPIQELIIYTSDKSSNRSDIETNVNNYYSIY